MVAITGATGLVGRYIVRVLLEKGFQVRCIVRSPVKAKEILGPLPELVAGDVSDLTSLQRSFRGEEKVIHLVAIIREQSGRSFTGINIDGTRNALRAAESAGCRSFIYMSALGAQNNPAYPYAHSKWMAEGEVRNSSLAWTIFRPSVIFGDGFGFFQRMEQSLRLSPPFLAAMPVAQTKFQPLYAGDLARCVVAALQNSQVPGRTFELGGPEQLTYGEMLGILLQKRRSSRIKVPIPVPLLKAVVPLMERVFKDPPVSSVELKQMEIDNTTALNAVEASFGFLPSSLKERL